MKLPELHTCAELRALIDDIGYIPLFAGTVPGFSVEEITPQSMWFKEGVIGPWEWREELAASGEVAYAKLFHGKAGFISRAAYPHFANFRRDGYDFDARVEDGLVRDRERKVYSIIQSGITLSGDMRRAYNGKSFESAITALEMRLYVTIARFDRKIDKHGIPYGWSISRFALAEDVFGDLCSAAYDVEPAKSFEVLADMLHDVIPGADAERLLMV